MKPVISTILQNFGLVIKHEKGQKKTGVKPVSKSGLRPACPEGERDSLRPGYVKLPTKWRPLPRWGQVVFFFSVERSLLAL